MKIQIEDQSGLTEHKPTKRLFGDNDNVVKKRYSSRWSQGFEL